MRLTAIMDAKRARRIWQYARRIDRESRRGKMLITVDRDLVARVQQYVWTLEVSRANNRWKDAVNKVSPGDWQAAMRDRVTADNPDRLEPF